MKVIFNSKSPTRIEVLLHPGDELEVDPELGARLLAANANLEAPEPKPKPRPKPAGKGRSS